MARKSTKEELKLSGKTKEDKQVRGTVKWFNIKKGYGFIVDGDGKNWFFHYSNVMKGYKDLFSDDIVDFEVGIGKNGREQAINVTPIITMKMVEDALSKDNLSLWVAVKDDDCVVNFCVSDENYVFKTDENGISFMSFIEVAAYAGIDTEGLFGKNEENTDKVG